MRSASAITLLLLVPSAVAAQSIDQVPILELEWSARALALGNSFVLNSDDANAIFYNPATLSDNGGIGVGGQKLGAEATAVNASAATEWADGALAIGLRSHARNLGGVATSAAAVSLGYARNVWGDDGVRLGVSATVLEQRSESDDGVAGALNVGIAKEIGPFVLGLAARNLGPSMDLGAEDIALPREFTLGATTAQEALGPLDLLATAAVTRRYDGEIIPGAGMEISWWPIVGRTFIGRIGMRRVISESASPLTLGAGFAGDKFSIDYAFQSLGGNGDIHRVGLSWR